MTYLDTIPEFDTVERFWVESRRLWAHTVKFPPTPAGEIRALLGERIWLDGNPCLVEGVESFAVSDSASVTRAGFLVRPFGMSHATKPGGPGEASP